MSSKSFAIGGALFLSACAAEIPPAASPITLGKIETPSPDVLKKVDEMRGKMRELDRNINVEIDEIRTSDTTDTKNIASFMEYFSCVPEHPDNISRMSLAITENPAYNQCTTHSNTNDSYESCFHATAPNVLSAEDIITFYTYLLKSKEETLHCLKGRPSKQ